MVLFIAFTFTCQAFQKVAYPARLPLNPLSYKCIWWIFKGDVGYGVEGEWKLDRDNGVRLTIRILLKRKSKTVSTALV